jgi:hypothetical protein
VSDNAIVRGAEFVRRLEALGRQRGVVVRLASHRGKGSHSLLYFGSKMTTIRNLRDEIDKRALHHMLRQLGLSRKDLE